MPRANSTQQRIGVFGEGKASARTINALLDDFIGKRDVCLYFVAAEPEFTEEHAAVMAWADDNDIDYHVITNDTSSNSRTLRNIVKLAKGHHEADAGQTETVLVNLLKERDDSVLLALWDDEAEENSPTYACVEYALESGVEVRDLAGDLQALNADADEDEDDQQDTADDEEEQSEPAEDEEHEDDGLPSYAVAKKLGIRALKRLGREHLSKEVAKTLPGIKDVDEVLALLYPDDAEPAPVAPVPDPEEEVTAAEVEPDLQEQVGRAAVSSMQRSAAVVSQSLAQTAVNALAAAIVEVIRDEVARAVAAEVKKGRNAA